MRFPLKLAISAVLAKTILADVTHLPQTQQHPNELDMKYSTQQEFDNQEVSVKPLSDRFCRNYSIK